MALISQNDSNVPFMLQILHLLNTSQLFEVFDATFKPLSSFTRPNRDSGSSSRRWLFFVFKMACNLQTHQNDSNWRCQTLATFIQQKWQRLKMFIINTFAMAVVARKAGTLITGTTSEKLSPRHLRFVVYIIVSVLI